MEGMIIMANISTQEFAAELGTDTRTVRKFLRSITPKEEQPGKGSRWAIDGTKRSLNQMKKRFDEWTAEREAEAEVEAETPAEGDDTAELDAVLDD